MTTNFLFAQAPNRHGNQSKHTATGHGGVTAVTRPQGDVSYSKGHQGAPSTGKDATCGRHQKVSVSKPDAYNTKATNTGYMDRSTKNYLK